MAVLSADKFAGRHVSVDIHEGKGSVINVFDNRRMTGAGSGSGPPPFTCDGSTTVHASITASNETGTCPTHIDFTTMVNGTVTGDYVFDSASSLGTAEFCTFSTGTMEITNGTLHLVCETDSTSWDDVFFISLRLVVVITAGDIEGTMYNVGDWVLLVGSIYEIIPPVGVCAFCISAHASTWLVFPGLTNTTTITDGGVSVDLSLTFTF